MYDVYVSIVGFIAAVVWLAVAVIRVARRPDLHPPVIARPSSASSSERPAARRAA